MRNGGMTMNVNVDNETHEIFYKGDKMLIEDLVEIHTYYEVKCTAEFIAENHADIQKDKVWELAEEVRYLMDDCDYSEIEAIDYVLKEKKERSNT